MTEVEVLPASYRMDDSIEFYMPIGVSQRIGTRLPTMPLNCTPLIMGTPFYSIPVQPIILVSSLNHAHARSS